MNFWKSFTGMMELELTSAEPEEALSAANLADIQIFRIMQMTELTYVFQIQRKDFGQLSQLLQRRGDSLRVSKKMGIYWDLKALLHRPVLIFTLSCLLLSAFYLPSRILFTRVEGNVSIPSQQILDAAESCGIQFGASRKKVRSEKVKNALLESVPELQWAGVNTSGCVAVISVRERKEEKLQGEENIVSNIVADRDGYIISGTITSGNALFHPGETVRKGQILISGYTDCGICIQAERAEGEILAQTNRQLTAITPNECIIRREITDTKHRFSLLFRKKRINLWKDSRISDTDCGRMYEEYFVTLPGGFQLPIALCVEKHIYYDSHEAEIAEIDAQAQLQNFSDNCLHQQMIAGKIMQKQQRMLPVENCYVLESNYTCIEMIGKEQREQIGDLNGKRN